MKCHLKKLKRKNVTLVTQATWLDCCCLQYQKKEIVTGRDIAAAWQIALLAITYDGRSVLTQLILGDQSVLKRVFLSRRQCRGQIRSLFCRAPLLLKITRKKPSARDQRTTEAGQI